MCITHKNPIIKYDREQLLHIRAQLGNIPPRDGLLLPGLLPEPRRQRKRRGRRAGVLVRLRRRAHRPPLPSILLANVQSLDNKLDELRSRLAFQRDIKNCCVLAFTETWLNPLIPDFAIAQDGFSIHRQDRTNDSGKSKGGGVCFMINNKWCSDVGVISKGCSPHLEYLMIACRPYYLPREFTSVVITGVYIPPHADSTQALDELYGIIDRTETSRPEAAFIVAGDFNNTNLRKVLPKFHQHIGCATRGNNTLDHVYTHFRDGYKALPRPPFGKSDHASVLLLPSYRQKLKRDWPTTRSIQRWSSDSDSALRHCFATTDWAVFKDNNIDCYTDATTSYIGKCIDDVVPRITVRAFPNQKPWVNGEVRAKLKARADAHNSDDLEEHRKSRYELRRAIRSAKSQYREKVESNFQGSNTRNMWTGLRAITDYKEKTSSAVLTSASFPDELNTFYARFENTSPAVEVPKAQDSCPLTISRADVCRAFKRTNPHKAPGPDGIPGRVLKACAVQLADVFTDIFNLSLLQSVVPLCFKKSTIVPVPKKSKALCLNDYRPVALTSTIMKCFERLVKTFITSTLPESLDPLQFAYRPNRSTDDAISLALHTALSHLDQRSTYVRMLFIDYSSAFNTIVPSKLAIKLRDLGLNTALCDWILSFLSGRPQAVRVGTTTSSTLTLNTGAPQGCVLSPLLYSLFTHDCVAKHSSNTIIKFADDTTVIGLITDGDETAYREEVRALSSWCQDNNLHLNVGKTKELIVDYRRGQSTGHAPIHINGAAVERVSSFRFLGVHISEDLTWDHHADIITRTARQRLFFLRRLRRINMDPRILCNFYRCTIESILTGCITAWYGSCTALKRKALQRVVNAARRITRSELPSMEVLYQQRSRKKASKILKDPFHPSHKLFCLLPSGRRFRSIRTRTTRLKDSFFPQAIRLLNNHT